MEDSRTAKLRLLRKQRLGRKERSNLLDLVHQIGESDVRDAEPDIAALMGHEDPMVRHGAINVLSFHWVLPQYASDFARVLQEDRDENVRGVAAAALGCVLEGTRTDWATGLLVGKVHDTAETVHVRETAYRALMSVAVPRGSALWQRAEASLERLDSAYRNALERAEQRTALGEQVYDTYTEVDRLWNTLIDWELVEAIKRPLNG